MGLIKTGDLTPGMVLSADLSTKNGRLLLPKGMVLDDHHIRSMATMGITAVDIQGAVPSERVAQTSKLIPPEVLERGKDYTRRIFRLCNARNEAVREMARLSLSRTTFRLTQGVALPDEADPSEDLLHQEGMDQPGRKGPNSPHELVRNEVLLSSFPDIYYQITQILKDPKSSATNIADVIGKDPSLSAKLLQLVNSPFYGFPARVDSLTRAVALTGTKELSMLAMSISVMRLFKDIPAELFDMKAFWQHSIACGLFAKLLAKHTGQPTDERFFLAGLLHDIGRLILLKRLPRPTRKALVASRLGGTALHVAEKEQVGFDHSRVAGLLLMEWNFPKPLAYMVNHHHAPAKAEHPLDPSIIHVADILAIALRLGSSGAFFVPPLDETAWNALQLPVVLLESLVDTAEAQFLEISGAFLQTG